jgi:hypothetical protein
MLYREIIAVCSQIHTKHIHTLCGQNGNLLRIKASSSYSYHLVLRIQHAMVTIRTAWCNVQELCTVPTHCLCVSM